MYVVRVAPEKRDPVRAAMADAGVATSVHYPSLARHPLFGNEQHDGCCGDEDKRIITLPTFAELTADDQRRVVDALAFALDGVRDRAPSASSGRRQMTLG
jgi:dTDP-4-amino-4,6-dideoxygalactose transaminase